MTNSTSFDVIVIGVGAMGSAACAFLAERGVKVLGIEQFDVVHERGSHSGQSRIIRKAYFEHPDYVPLLEHSYFNWKKLEEETGSQVYYETGIVYFGQSDGEIIPGVTKAGLLYDINLEKLSHDQAQTRFPAFRIPNNFKVIFEPEAGFLIPERAIRQYVAQAIKRGATIHENEPVLSWNQESGSVIVKTSQSVYKAKKLVFTSGSWTGKLLEDFSQVLTVRRQLLAWMQPAGKQFDASLFPCWFIEDPSLGLFYGFSKISNDSIGGPEGIKLAHHHPGVITNPDAPAHDLVEPPELLSVIDKYIPSAGKRFTALKDCLYTYSPDSDFIIDFLPGTDKHVVVACGFSGHGFKFASAVGEIIADLALEGGSHHPIDFLRLDRLETKKQ